MKTRTEKERLAGRATRLKKAFLLACVIAGRRVRFDEAVLPAYVSWDKRRLRTHVDDLEHDVVELMRLVVAEPARALQGEQSRWLAEQFDRREAAGPVPFTICTAEQFEKRFGLLLARQRIEIPPYAELLLQPPAQVAFRHPEYMLVRDLSALLDYFLDAENLFDSVDWSQPPDWAAGPSENSSALARAVVQTCFNLLEAFVSGLARAHVMRRPGLDSKLIESLLSSQGSLGQRIVRVPALIAGRENPLNLNTPALGFLFREIKPRRDAFVHCEPGSTDERRGYVKEAVFHDVTPDLVKRTVGATHEVIGAIWEFVHRRPGPRWLPALDESGRLQGRNLQLVPRTHDPV